MLERLNFYDVYAYLIPGIVFVGLLWLPFAVTNETFLKLDWSSALLVLVLAYIAGHVIQGLANSAFPSTKKDKGNRYPSDFLLDHDDGTFCPEVKERLTRRILITFDLDVRDPIATADRSAVTKRRSDAFLMCRRALIQEGRASYAEQFEGMYTLMRGLTAAWILGSAYYLGLLIRYAERDLLNIHAPLLFFESAVAIILLALLTAVRVVCSVDHTRKTKFQKQLFWLVTFLLFLLAALIPPEAVVAMAPSFLIGLNVTLLFLFLRCYSAYDEFSRLFAATVYRDFCALKL